MDDERLSRLKGARARGQRVTREASRPLCHKTLARLRLAVTLGIFVVYPACASVQREPSTSVTGYGAGGVTGDSSFDCDGTRTSTVHHRQASAGGEVARHTRGALGGGARVAGLWGHVSHAAVAAGAPVNYGLGNVGFFLTGDYEWVGHELGLGLTFQLDDRSSPIPSPWYRLRLGRKDVLFVEVTAGSRDGLLLSHSLAELALGAPTSFGTLRLGVRWGGRAIVDREDDSSGVFLAVNSFQTGDVSAYLETQIPLSEKAELFASLEAGGQLPAVRVGLTVRFDDAPRPCSGACSREVRGPAPVDGDVRDDPQNEATPTGASALTMPTAQLR